ncbi:MAG: pirin family protein [Burkholderiales bacterium]
MLTLRPARERGHADHGWLDSYHSFSFADYHDPAHMGFGPLRVINEDRVRPGMGFGTHGHRDMEIVSYVLEGRLSHRDNMGNGSVIVPGDIQRMSAGRGVMHSEFNPSASEDVHFLQIWIEPAERGIAPSYEQATVAPDAKRGKLALLAAPPGEGGAVTIHQDAKVYAGTFDGAETATLALAPGRRAYVHVARGTATVSGVPLGTGDAVKLAGEPAVRIESGGASEVLVFDLP